MPKFQRKDAFVDAVQWNKMGDHPSVLDNDIRDTNDQKLGWFDGGSYRRVVKPGDWIVTEHDGKIKMMPADVFAETYAPAGG